MPEFIAVAIPETNKIVVVVRVEAVPAHWPVVMNGQVFIRNPGQTIRATHDQILDLVRRRSEAASPTELAFSVASTHSPASVYGEAAAGRGDLFVRLATAVYARPGPGLSVTFGADERLVIDDALNASSFARLIDDAPWRGSQRQRERLRLTADEFSSMHYAAHCEYGDGETRHRLGLRVQRHGLQVSVHIELEARLPRDLSTATTPRVGREELALTALCGLETLSLHMVPALARLVGGAPMHVDDVYLWAESPRIQNLGNAVDVSRVHRPVEGTRTNWIATLSQVGSLEEAVEKVRRPLEAFYLDLGFDEERQVVDDDLRRAVGVRNGLA